MSAPKPHPNAKMDFRCEHVILRERASDLAIGIGQLRGAIESLGRAGFSYPTIYRAVEQAERGLKYAERALDKLPALCGVEECRG